MRLINLCMYVYVPMYVCVYEQLFVLKSGEM
jgi:hypothetical protein